MLCWYPSLLHTLAADFSDRWELCKSSKFRLPLPPECGCPLAEHVEVAFGGKIFCSDSTLVDVRVVFCDVIGIVFSSRPPEVAELLLDGAASEPIDFHVH